MAKKQAKSGRGAAKNVSSKRSIKKGSEKQGFIRPSPELLKALKDAQEVKRALGLTGRYIGSIPESETGKGGIVFGRHDIPDTFSDIGIDVQLIKNDCQITIRKGNKVLTQFTLSAPDTQRLADIINGILRNPIMHFAAHGYFPGIESQPLPNVRIVQPKERSRGSGDETDDPGPSRKPKK